jgi:hypothetical protein
VLTKRTFARLYLMYMKQGRQHAWDTLKTATPELVLRRTMKIRNEVAP